MEQADMSEVSPKAEKEDVGKIEIDVSGKNLMEAGKLLAERIKNPRNSRLDQNPLALIILGGFQTAIDNQEGEKLIDEVLTQVTPDLHPRSPQIFHADESKKVKIEELLEASRYLGTIVQAASQSSDLLGRNRINCDLLTRNTSTVDRCRWQIEKSALGILDTLMLGFTENIGTKAILRR